MTDEANIVNQLMPYAVKPPSADDRGLGTRYSWRLNIPARTLAIPSTQNIPSNLRVIGDGGEGTIRPPLVDPTDAVPSSESELEDAILDIVGREDVGLHIPESSAGTWLRPHVKVDADVDRYIEVARRLFEDYRSRLEGDKE